MPDKVNLLLSGNICFLTKDCE